VLHGTDEKYFSDILLKVNWI